MKQNKIQGYDVKDRLKCKWCSNFVPFSGNGQKICRLYELGQCKFIDGRLDKKITSESTQIKTQMKHTKKPIKKIKEETGSNKSDEVPFNLLRWECGGDTRPRLSKLTNVSVDNVQIDTSTRNGYKGVTFTWTENMDSWGYENKQAKGFACLFCNINDMWIGGRFANISSNSKHVDLANIKSEYDGWKKEYLNAHEFVFLVISNDGKLRSTVVRCVKKPTSVKEDVSPDAGKGEADPMVVPVDSNPTLDKLLAVLPEFQQFMDAVGRFVDTSCSPAVDQTMVNEPPAVDTTVVVTDHFQKADVTTEAATSESTYEITWVTNTNSQSKIRKEIYDSGLDQKVKIEIRVVKYGTSSEPIVRLTGDKDTIKTWIHKAYDQETDIDYLDELYLMDGTELDGPGMLDDEPVMEATGDTFKVGDKIRFINADVTTEAVTADGVGPDNATYEIDWVTNSEDGRNILKEIYATGLDKTVKLKIVGNDMHPGTNVRLTGNPDIIKNWIHTEYDQEWPVDEIDDQFRVYDHKLPESVTESTFIKNLGEHYARLGKLCR